MQGDVALERKHMIVIIEEFVKLREYYEKTFYLGVNICDRYIISLARRNESPACLLNLALASVFLAAKIEQHICPSLEVLCHTVQTEWNLEIDPQAIMDLETAILRELDWDLHCAYPETFLERYFMIFGVDPTCRKKAAKQVRILARRFCQEFMTNENSLYYKSSQIAAASVMAALNIS